MIANLWTATLTATITLLVLVITSPAFAAITSTPNSAIDLAKTPDSTELTGTMLAIPGSKQIQTLGDALRYTDWVQPDEDTLDAPRQITTTWLQATVHNSSDQALVRWLVLEPWRLNRVDAFFLKPNTDEILWQKSTGLSVPLQERTIRNGKTIVPVRLNAGEAQQLILKIQSDNLPFISVKNWDSVSYSHSLTDNRIFLAALFASILTLLLILTFQFNVGLLLTGTWLLVAFILEAEKNGFFSNYLLPFLEGYSVNLRVSSAMLSVQLFVATSVFLLGLNKQRFWRRLMLFTASLALLMAGLTFVLDGTSIRKLGILVLCVYLASWLLMIAPALKIRRAAQVPLLLLLSAYWLTTSLLLLGYTFNFYYTASFAPYRLSIEFVIAIALILTYSWQQKQLLKTAENTLRKQESESRRVLELAVVTRTEQLNSALESARKASIAKVNFLGQITHDLRAPLTAILGYAQLQSLDPASVPKANQIIQDRAHYMKDMVDGLVNYAEHLTVDTDQLNDIYLIAFIDNLVAQAHIFANKQNNQFQLKIESDLPTVIRCNSTHLQRIMFNLLDNAAKYTSDGDISLSITFSDEGSKPSLIFSVRDSGRGIAPHILEKIYTPFYQGSEENPGAGLGLAICFELTEALGGTLHLESELDKGTTATCTIPYVPGDEQLATHSLPAVQDLLPIFDAQGATAWVVEDSPHVREILGNELTDMGFEVELAETAEFFMEAAVRNGVTPAVIITDYHLPGASGIDVLHAARAQWPDTPVMLLSATHSFTPMHKDTPSERFNAFLPKPIDLLGLRLKLAKLCNLDSKASGLEGAT